MKPARVAMVWDQVLEETGTESDEWKGWWWGEVAKESLSSGSQF